MHPGETPDEAGGNGVDAKMPPTADGQDEELPEGVEMT